MKNLGYDKVIGEIMVPSKIFTLLESLSGHTGAEGLPSSGIWALNFGKYIRAEEHGEIYSELI